MKKNNLDDITFIVPVRNEAVNITLFYETINTLYTNYNVIFIYDFKNDNSINELIHISTINSNVKYLYSKKKGIRESIIYGLNNVKTKNVGVLLADDLGILYKLDILHSLVIKNPEKIISGTRYTKGGKRMYGSFVEIIFSKTANLIFKILYNLDDATTAFKFGNLETIKSIYNKTVNNNWSINLEVAFIAKKNNIEIIFVPIISIDRLRFGKSTFKLKTWLIQYLKIFLKKLNGKYN